MIKNKSLNFTLLRLNDSTMILCYLIFNVGSDEKVNNTLGDLLGISKSTSWEKSLQLVNSKRGNDTCF